MSVALTFRRALRRLRTSPSPSRRPRPTDRGPLRIAVIGLGTIGSTHASELNASSFYELTAIVSGSATTESVRDTFGCMLVRDLQELIGETKPEILLVATPHRLHASAVVPALTAGIHVICEKPMSVSAADADVMVAAARAGSAKLTVMSQTRFEPSYRDVKTLVDSGELGPVRRISITETFWRSDAYYQSGSWRGTWAGEGGGVMVNQAPHVLDRYLCMGGRPDRVSAHCETVLHDIEVEDTATLILSHDNGIQGHIHISTTECPPICRMEIACDRGRVTVDQGAITIERLDESIQTATRDRNEPMGSIGHRVENRGGSLLNWSPELLHAFYEDFADAIWNGREPEVTPEAARDVVEIINAAHLSAHHRKQIQLPVDRQAYEDFQQTMQETSTE